MSAPHPMASFDAFYRSESPRLLRFFRSRVGSELAPDLVQDAFARVLRSGPFERIDNPQAYLSRTARNLLIELRRREIREQGIMFALDQDRDAPLAPEQSWQIDLAETRRAYWEALRLMPQRTRRVFLMHRLRNMTYAEIAEQIGIRPSGIEYHMMRALATCRKEVAALSLVTQDQNQSIEQPQTPSWLLGFGVLAINRG